MMHANKSRGKQSDKHYLRPWTATIEHKNVLVYDVESKQGDSQEGGFSRAFLMGFHDGEKFFSFRNLPTVEHLPWWERANAPGGCIDQFMRHVLCPDKPEYQAKNAIFYAHNGGRFDSSFVLTWLLEHTSEFAHEIISVQGRAQVVNVWVKNGNRKEQSWVFTDSALLLQMSLEKAGEVFCPETPKLKMDLATHESRAQWEEYNRRDCETLLKAMERFQGMVEAMGGALGMTAPATAMRTFRRRFQEDPIKRNTHFKKCKSKLCDGCLQKWIIDGYHGGRTEIFKTNAKESVHYYDINSSYAASMLEPMPVGDAKEFEGDFRTTRNFAQSMSKNYIGFVECTVTIPKTCHIPPLPYVLRESKAIRKLVFPVGTFHGIWNFEELQLLHHPLVGGRIEEITRSVWFRKKPIFVDYINTLYKLRDKTAPDYDPALSELAKLLMNSLYGKFGMKRDRERLVSIDTGEAWPKNDDGSFARPIDGDHDHCKLWIQKHRVDAPYIIPQISAHITALSRIRLWLGMAAMMEQGGEVYYTDTDSIMGNRTMREGTKLGEWKREFPGQILSGIFILPKLYALINERGEPVSVKMKGVGKKAQSFDNFKRAIAGIPIHFTRIEQHRSILRKKLSGPVLIRVVKELRTNYTKRIVLPNGTTRPIRIGEDYIEKL